MRIIVITHSLGTNYGGLLQAFALQKVLLSMGHEVRTAKYKVKRPLSFFKKILHFCYHSLRRYICRDKHYNPFIFLLQKYNPCLSDLKRISINTDRFITSHIKTIDFFEGKIAPSADMIANIDAIVVGSDQVWRPKFMYVPTYFLYFSKGMNIKKIAYAASFGTDNINEFKPKILEKCREGIKYFDAISVREDSAVKLCNDFFDVDAVHLLDPTMLLDKEDYMNIIEERDQVERKNIIMCYVLDKTKEKEEIIKKIASKLDLTELYVMPQIVYPEYTKDKSNWVYPSVSEWIAGFRDAEFVVTDSFHGTVFSIIFNKPFVVINNFTRGSSRFTSLLKIFGLEHRLINSQSELNDKLFDPIDFIHINEVRSQWKNRSNEFIINGLK